MALSEQYQQQIINTIKELPEGKTIRGCQFCDILKGRAATLYREKYSQTGRFMGRV